MDGSPERIECFDISNVQGSDIVASMVVFTGGEPTRREYRKFKVRDVSPRPKSDDAQIRELWFKAAGDPTELLLPPPQPPPPPALDVP